ncbi:MAG: hypothetical protein HXS41_09900 [Theionarchaea archaeon]|nr:hypothetical protein [Theionarchaea archaeon]MBU6999375.1 hypothetical protein [Theionarchaea archaeon]MBU7021358.1 hypothetical protein [Theionarchaea archaeon]MBU7036037.1 hypothetical protein [Theionarchaea archaeon]MBU7041785.1 hypothetical protein [Theionarchaea archaeon]
MRKSFLKTRKMSQVRMKAKSGRGTRKPSQARRSRKTRRADRSLVSLVNPRTRRTRTAAVRQRGLMNMKTIRMKGTMLRRATGKKSSRKVGTRKRK